MANGTAIEWTEATWNPVAGCTIVSPGCTNCYAMRLASRLEKMGSEKYKGLTRISGGRAKWNGHMRVDVAAINTPKLWKKGRLIFVNSMSDLFHEAISINVLKRIFNVMVDANQHVYQILTKRPERALEVQDKLSWPNHIWLGTSVENADYAWRIDALRKCKAAVRFLSLEPLLGPLDELELDRISWVIAGGESGVGARPMNPDWVRSIRDQCVDAKVAFHFKQWGGVNKKKAGRVLDNRTWDQLPKTHLGIAAE